MTLAMRSSVFIEIVELIGEREADQITTYFSGRKIYFFEGKAFPEGAGITKRSWEVLCKRFRKNQIQFTSCNIKKSRNQRIVACRRNGMSVGDIANAEGLSYRQVINICNAHG